MLSFPIVYVGAFSSIVPITSGRRDDVSSTVFLMGLLAGASGGCREATESPRLFVFVSVSRRLAAYKKDKKRQIVERMVVFKFV